MLSYYSPWIVQSSLTPLTLALASLVSFGFITIFSVAITNKVEYDGLELEREETSMVTSITNVFQLAISTWFDWFFIL